MGRENKSRYAVMGMLTLQPMSGYDLKKLTEISIDNFWQENYAQIYPILKQLAEEGLAVKHTEKQEGRPERSIYALTEMGQQALQKWLAEPAEDQVERHELLLKLFFGVQVPLSVCIEHVRSYREKQVRTLETYEQTESAVIKEYEPNTNVPYWRIALNYGRHHTRAVIAWCDETLLALKECEEQEALLATKND